MVEPGTVLIFGIVLAPVYAMLIGWFAGEPSDPKIATLGIGYLVGLIASLWIALTVISVLIGVVFFDWFGIGIL